MSESQIIQREAGEREAFEAWVRGEWPQAPLRMVRDLLPKTDPRYKHYCDESLQRAWVGWQARAAQPAPAVVLPDECPHMIVFDDADREPLMFAGAGARDAAMRTWEQVSIGWNAHLFVRVMRNCRDDRYPCATLAAAPAPPVLGEPCAHSDHVRPADGVCVECGEVVQQAEQVPVGEFRASEYDGEPAFYWVDAIPPLGTKLYTAPPAAPAQDVAGLVKRMARFVEAVRECERLASSYCGCIDGVEEQGGDDHEDPTCAIWHRLYYAMFDADAALADYKGGAA